MSVRLYPNVIVKGQSFKGVKRVVVPKQSMGLREIIQRFVRRESLPSLREGVYEDRLGDIDLEKVSKADITEQLDVADQIKSALSKREKRLKDRAVKDKAAADELAAKQSSGAPPPPGEGKPDQKSPPQGA